MKFREWVERMYGIIGTEILVLWTVRSKRQKKVELEVFPVVCR